MLAIATAVLCCAGIVVVAVRSPSASTLLERARDHADRHDAVAFEGRLRTSAHPDGHEPGDPGHSLVQDLDVAGIARFPDTTRFTADDGETLTEVLAIGADLFVRSAEGRRRLRDEKWIRVDLDDDERNGVTRPGPEGPQELGEIRDLRRILAATEAEGSAIVGRGRGTVDVRARLRNRAAFGRLGDEVRSATATITMTRAGRVSRLRLRLELVDGTIVTDYRLRDWGIIAEVAAPAESDIDATPDLDEEAVLAFDDAPLLQPRALPEGWSLQGAYVIDAESAAEECEQVGLDFAPDDFDFEDFDSEYLSLYEIPADCEGLGGREEGDRPFRAGRHTGFARDLPEGGLLAQFVVGRTVIQADTNLHESDLVAIVADLVPLDFDAEYAELPAVGRSSDAA